MATLAVTRRQNRSCDQCRRSKRACDTTSNSRRDSAGDSTSAYSDALVELDLPHRPCSYCLKTKKRCTYTWARAQLSQAASRRRASGSEVDYAGHDVRKKRRRMLSSATQDLEYLRDGLQFNCARLPETPPAGFNDRDSLFTSGVLPWFDEFNPSLQPSNSMSIPFRGTPVNETAPQPGSQESTSSESAEKDAQNSFDMFPGFGGELESTEVVGVPYAAWNPDHYQSWPNSEEDLAAVSICSPQSYQASSQCWLPRPSFSPYTVEQTMVAASNNHLISDNLLHIYHDVLEHNLCCWLVEETCPYSMLPSSRGNNTGSEASQLKQGATWTNRILSRVVRLDRYARSTNLIQLSRDEDQAASRALHTAIMAFASQWAQGSHRERQQYPSSGFESEEGFAEEFDRNVQKSLWEQAWKALQDVAELESFRVVCAELVFGLSQRPWDGDDVSSHTGGVKDWRGDRDQDIRAHLSAGLRAAIAKDGTPIHMERAARKMHALKFRWDASKAGLGHDNIPPKRPDIEAGFNTDSENEQTVALLYWLAVMFDTVSSSMNERPVVVADEDSQHCAASAERTDDNLSQGDSHQMATRWSMKLFIQDNPEQPVHTLRWPCSYEDAAEAVTRSAPVKVLLFRHVSYLQNVLRKKLWGEPVEGTIRSTMALYRYWNMTYGALFRDFVRHFPSVPPRLQSWFFCISAHWHLAALMFADLIDLVDKNNLGSVEASQSRREADVVKRIWRASANEISDLARVAVPANDADGTADASKAPELPNAHFAVNKCTILTEPWSIIVIRAFTKAAAMHLAQAQDLWETRMTDLGHEWETCEESLRRCEDCIKALWFLGKKSDMARNTADILSMAYSEVSGGISPNRANGVAPAS